MQLVEIFGWPSLPKGLVHLCEQLPVFWQCKFIPKVKVLEQSISKSRWDNLQESKPPNRSRHHSWVESAVSTNKLSPMQEKRIFPRTWGLYRRRSFSSGVWRPLSITHRNEEPTWTELSLSNEHIELLLIMRKIVFVVLEKLPWSSCRWNYTKCGWFRVEPNLLNAAINMPAVYSDTNDTENRIDNSGSATDEDVDITFIGLMSSSFRSANPNRASIIEVSLGKRSRRWIDSEQDSEQANKI